MLTYHLVLLSNPVSPDRMLRNGLQNYKNKNKNKNENEKKVKNMLPSSMFLRFFCTFAQYFTLWSVNIILMYTKL